MKRGIFIFVWLLGWVQQPFVTTHSFLLLALPTPIRSCRKTRTCQLYDRHHALWSSSLTIPTEKSAASSIEALPHYQPSVLRGTTAQHSAAWQTLLLPPPPSTPLLFLQPNSHRHVDGVIVDASVQWDPFHQPGDSRHVAEQLLQNAGIFRTSTNITTTTRVNAISSGSSTRRREQQQQQQVLDDLETSLQSFVDFCQQYYWPAKREHRPTHPTWLKARIVATRGPAGTKCPQWHVDHVPVRWIQAIVGPGCQWIVDNHDDNDNSAIHWDRINALHDDHDDDDDDNTMTIHDTPDVRNRLLIDAKQARIQQAAPGEAILLLGKTWPNAGMVARVQPPRPAVHKSPTLQWWQGRVLLTMDVVDGSLVEQENMSKWHYIH